MVLELILSVLRTYCAQMVTNIIFEVLSNDGYYLLFPIFLANLRISARKDDSSFEAIQSIDPFFALLLFVRWDNSYGTQLLKQSHDFFGVWQTHKAFGIGPHRAMIPILRLQTILGWTGRSLAWTSKSPLLKRPNHTPTRLLSMLVVNFH